MRGATTPRLLLELICARLLLPGVDDDSLGLGARLDRLERRVSVAGSAPGAPAPAVGPRRAGPRNDAAAAPSPPPAQTRRARSRPPEPPHEQASAQTSRNPRPAARAVAEPVAEAAPPAAAGPSDQKAGGVVLSLADVRRIWPDLLEQVKKMRRFTWILLSQNAQVIGVDATSLTVGFKTAGARDSFVGGGSEEILRQAAIDMLGADWQIEVAVDPSAQPGQETAPRVIRPAVADPFPDRTSRPARRHPRLHPAGSATTRTRPRQATSRPAQPPRSRPSEHAPRKPASAETIAAARAKSSTRTGDQPARSQGADLDADAHRAIPRPRTTASTAPSCSSASSARP